MSTNVTWNGTTYAIPAAGEVNWPALASFLIALGTSAAVADELTQAVRVATTSPVTVSNTTDCVVISNLGVAGPVAVNLPAGATGRIFFIVDGKGDAATNNVTIDGNGAETINGAANYVIADNSGGICIAWNGTGWTIIGRFLDGAFVTFAYLAGTPAIGTPSSLTLTNATGLPIVAGTTGTLTAARGGTGLTALGAGVATFLDTPSSANLAAALTDETGTGAAVFATSPTLVTPALGTPSAVVLTSATGLPLTTGVTGTLAIGNGGTGQTTANDALNALLPAQAGQAGKVLQTDATNASWAAVATTSVLTPVGSIVAYNPGYYTAGANAGFTVTGPGANTVAGVNAFLPVNWRVCDGTALNDASSPIWVGAGRFLPQLTDNRFLEGATTAGGSGGSSTMAHTHDVTSNVSLSDHPSHIHSVTSNVSLSDHAAHSHNIAHVHGVLYKDSGNGSLRALSTPQIALVTQSGGTFLISSFTVAAGGTQGSIYAVAGGAANGQYYSTGTISPPQGTDGSGALSSTQTLSHSGLVSNPAVNSGGSGTISHAGLVSNPLVVTTNQSNSENRPLYLNTFFIVRVS